MGKRKADDSSESLPKKNKKKGIRKKEKDVTGKDKKFDKKLSHSNSRKMFQNKRNKIKKVVPELVKKPLSMQEILGEKLRKVQETSKLEKPSNRTFVNSDISAMTEQELNLLTPCSDNYEVGNKSVKRSTNTAGGKNAKFDSAGDNERVHDSNLVEEEDAEKAAIGKKKREKRHRKKLEKERLTQEYKDKAGTAKVSAVEYLNQWKKKREDWKFSKVRQVWLLHNMYDKDLVDDDNFQTLMSYLEGLKGKSREVTVSEAEQIIEKTENQENDDTCEEMMDRARSIIQLLSC